MADWNPEERDRANAALLECVFAALPASVKYRLPCVVCGLIVGDVPIYCASSGCSPDILSITLNRKWFHLLKGGDWWEHL